MGSTQPRRCHRPDRGWPVSHLYEHVADLATLPVVGRRHLVPCVQVDGSRIARWSDSPEWVPVLGPEHDDAEIIGLHARHWHYDVRFLSNRQFDRAKGSASQTIPRGRDADALIAVIASDAVLDGPRVLPVRCRRQMPEFPVRMADGRPSHFAAALEAAYAGHRLKPDCRVCPHRGIPLAGLPVSDDGVVVCSGHGLAWDLRTRGMVRRVPAQPTVIPCPTTTSYRRSGTC